MKKAVSLFILVIVGHLVMAQADTVCRYPYLYFYNWPENVLFYEDSLCNYFVTDAAPFADDDEHQYWLSQLDFTTYITEFALYQHTDTPIDIVGLAIARGTVMRQHVATVTLYDSNMNELASLSGNFSFEPDIPVGSDTTAHLFYYPRCSYPSTATSYFYFKPFGKTVTVSGDFYIGVRDSTNNLDRPEIMYIFEFHAPPYHISKTNGYRLKINSTWSDLRTQRSIALLLPIIDSPCHAVDSMEVEVGADGCLRVSWEKPKLQSQWMVSLVADGGGEILQPTDTNYWEYCSLTPGRRYTVRLRSRCDNLYSHSWSDWGEPVSFGENHGIEAVTEPAVSVVPNPASARVAVRCGGRMTAVEVVDALGRTVLSIDGGGNEATLDVSALPTGLYTVLVTTPQGRTARHLTIVR